MCDQAFARLDQAIQREFKDHDPLIQALAMHYHFASIHPFLDGNGRMGRLLITALLEHWQLMQAPLLYVSGYLATERASATHAWTEVLIPGVGWQALDPTHNRQPDETYVKIAVGRDYADVAPVAGNYKGTTDRKMEVTVKINALD